MRVIDTYTFYYGTKIPFSEIPDRIHRFFTDQGLKSERFMYYFEDIAQYEPADEDAQNTEALKCVSSTHGCERILKDCPELGDIRFKQNPYRDRFSFLTNLDREPFPEGKILPLMKKIHKNYGFSVPIFITATLISSARRFLMNRRFRAKTIQERKALTHPSIGVRLTRQMPGLRFSGAH